jgi:hypothetical protein
MQVNKFTSNSYSACHKWLSKNFVKSNCEHCSGNRFIEWALKKGLKHRHLRENYLCLCSSCHKKYDYTPERRAKLSASLKLVPHTKKWNRKVVLANKGFRHSDESKKKMSDYKKKNPPKRSKITGRYV